MKRVLPLAAAVFGIGLWLPVPIQAQSSPEEEARCDAAVEAAGDRLEEGRALAVEASQHDLSTTRAAHLEERPIAQTFRLQGDAAADVMHSSDFMQSISAEIIEACPWVGSVSFNVQMSDWLITFGWIEGEVQPFQCAIDPRADIPWGYMACL